MNILYIHVTTLFYALTISDIYIMYSVNINYNNFSLRF